MKFYSRSAWGNISTYGKLILLLFAASYDPVIMQEFSVRGKAVERTAREVIGDVHDKAEEIWR